MEEKLLDEVQGKRVNILDQIIVKLHTVLEWSQDGESRGWKLGLCVSVYVELLLWIFRRGVCIATGAHKSSHLDPKASFSDVDGNNSHSH